MSHTFISGITPPDQGTTSTLWFIFYEDQILLLKSMLETALSIPKHFNQNIFDSTVLRKHYLGVWQNQHCFCAEIAYPSLLPETMLLVSLRQAGLLLDKTLFNLASRALQVIHWDLNHQFCGKCGKILGLSATERAKICSACTLLHYPKISPVIIVLIRREDKILLARSPHFKPGVYSGLAGFIEPGETAEHAVEREVMEEVGICIKNLRYRFSEPWCFSDALMLAFTAEHSAGEIMIDGIEIESANWYDLENLPALPPTITAGRKLVDLFIKGEF